MVGSHCVVQDCNNRSNQAAGIGLHSSSDKTKDVWLRSWEQRGRIWTPSQVLYLLYAPFTLRNIILLGPFTQASISKDVIFCNAWHFCYLLPSIWKGDLKKMHESERNHCMKEKEQQKLSTQNAQTSLCCCFKFHQVISYCFDQQLYKQ